MKLLAIASLAFILLSLFLVSDANHSSRRRRSKEIEDKVRKLDEGTKKRILAMKAQGVPTEAIAEKITYQAGGKKFTASKVVDAVVDQSKRENAQKAQAVKNNNKKKSKKR